MNEQPEALRLADALEVDKWHISGVTAQSAADELRRLHAVNAELLEALRRFANTDLTVPVVRDTFGFDVLYARAAIAKAEGEPK